MVTNFSLQPGQYGDKKVFYVLAGRMNQKGCKERTRNHCVVHYGNIREEKLIKLTDASHKTLLDNKAVREKLGGDNWHEEQCRSIPSFVGEECYYHQTCYAKFTLAKSYARRLPGTSSLQETDQGASVNLRSSSKGNLASDILFPRICFICRKGSAIVVNRKKQFPTKVVTKIAQETLVRAAVLKEDSDLLLQIKDQRELLKHENRYKDYTRIVSKGKDETRNIKEESINRFEVVCQIIEKRVIDCSQAISMSALIEVYGGSSERQYRYVLKERLSKRFSDQIIFLKSEYHEPYIVVSAACLQSTPHWLPCHC